MTDEQTRLINELIACIDEGERLRPAGLPDFCTPLPHQREPVRNALFIDVRLLKGIRAAFHGR